MANPLKMAPATKYGGKIVVCQPGTCEAAKSKDTDRVVFVRQTFADSPTALLTNMEFAAAKPMQTTNANQDDYTWGRAELVNYTVMGQPLQGTLIYPADWEQGKTYPMVTYIYERLSDGFHQYQMPSNTSPYNQQHFSQNGYFVLRPDIVFRGRDPGIAVLEALQPAVRAVTSRGLVDSTKVGLVGHSWAATRPRSSQRGPTCLRRQFPVHRSRTS